ncbi:hypothetical protein [Croceicoccus marinus]|uniref:DUF1963 domain-containing protein n=1 Tax=Croceicoccus marinus TaxID=450378 RepID=A0A217EYT3_9SPHN|nr:hypothetical protein [Croceicoccus marinus]ARU18289.1 hypothetical protein A9D14_18205 [Croceicoccus marinus]
MPIDLTMEPRNETDAAFFRELTCYIKERLAADAKVGVPPIDLSMVADGSSDDAVGFVMDLLNMHRYVLKAAIELRPIAQLDRTCSMVAGPLYTSPEFPWPSNDGLHLEPILQLDLDWLSAESGRNVGQGLVQVWMDGSDSLTRVLPGHSVTLDQLTPPPLARPLTEFDFSRNVYSWDATSAKRTVWVEAGRQITGIAGRTDQLHQMVNRLLDIRSEDHADEYDANFVQRAESIAKVSLPDSCRFHFDTIELFGNYFPWNWDAGISYPLIKFEDDMIFNFHTDGYGVLFYDREPNGKFYYNFDWGL